MKSSVIGYPRIGTKRELKFALERYFRNEISTEQLQYEARQLKQLHWRKQLEAGISYIPSNDFSFYDGVLDTATLFNIIPKRYADLNLNRLDTYFAMARGYQGNQGDVKALAMKKWFNTNYHYLVPELEDTTEIKLIGSKIFDEYKEAKELGIETKPTLIGPFTLLKVARLTGAKQSEDYIAAICQAYANLLAELHNLGVQWLQLEEPSLVTELVEADLQLFTRLYDKLLSHKKSVKVLLQTYYGDVRDSYTTLQTLPFDGIGLDFVEGVQTLSIIQTHGWNKEQLLFAGVVNGKNIWKNNYAVTLDTVKQLLPIANIVLGTSCSLLHVPYTTTHEQKVDSSITTHLAFAEEKLIELQQLSEVSVTPNYEVHVHFVHNKTEQQSRVIKNKQLNEEISALTDHHFTRIPSFNERELIQKEALKLGVLPTTTIGSFPQTADVRANRAAFKKGSISETDYKQYNFDKIKHCIKQQEEIGLDVLVHGEYERNDMVEYFGESLNGFLFTEYAWVQSYGTRCVKPPIIWGDVTRAKSITVETSVYANSLTTNYVKGMLTGPVTILNWSFPREDISLQVMAYQIGLAIRDEVLDLEANGIQIIQIDEAALREKLPLRQSDWHTHYLDWAIPSFRLTHSGVKPETQIHTHMCYSQFSDIIKEIDEMDADVITFEASRSDLSIIDTLYEVNFQTQVGPGVYDIHSPRIPSVEELEQAILRIFEKVGKEKLWINPDCGLKTRGEQETWASLANLVEATKRFKRTL